MGPPCNPHTGWRIVDGRLFCAINSDYMDKWIDETGSQGVKDGDARWTNWFGAVNEGPINTGCFPGSTLQTCMDSGKPFPNRDPLAATIV